MKFRTTDLIERIDAILKAREVEKEAEKVEAEAKEAQHRAEWLAEHSEHYLAFAERIKYHLKRNEPLTFNHVPVEIRDRYNTLKFYSTPSTRSSDDRRAESLTKLRNALQASQEDTVSPTAIKQLGFQDVTFLFTTEAGK